MNRIEKDEVRENRIYINWMDRRLGVPLAQLEGVQVDGDTAEAIGDWHYWIARGYSSAIPASRVK